jgi:hypothetical protein
MRRALRVLAVVGLVTSVLADIGPAAAAGAAGAGWTTSSAEYVANQNFILNAVDVPTAADVWAVGYRYESVGGATEFRTVVEHSAGGGGFTLVPSPDRETAPATDFLQDVSGVSASTVWAVGWSRPPGGASRTLVEEWDGAAWSIVATPDPGQYGNILQGVTALASDDVWAVGARQDSFYQAPLAEHWDGSSWSAAAVPNPSYCTGHSYLTDVTATAPANVWAVGWCTASGRGGEQGYLEHWNGTHWSIPALSAAVPQNSELYGVSVGAGGLWAVGLTRDGGALALHRHRHSWDRPPVGAPQTGASLAGVVATAHGAWAVGAGTSPQPPFAGPVTVRFSAGQGLPRPVPVDFGSLRGVAHDPAGRLWAVGTQLPGSYNTPLIVSRPAT